LGRWRTVEERFPESLEAVGGVVISLKHLRRSDELEEFLGQKVKRFAGNADLAIEYAYVAQQKGAWPEALERWNAARERFPENEAVAEGIRRVLFHVQMEALEQSEETPAQYIQAARSASTSLKLEIRDVMLRFESLGSGCEFGLVQRRFGAEPLGLLRWGAIPAPALVAALKARFEGIGNPACVKLFEFGASNEYFYRDEQYAMEMHTFLPANPANYERIFAQQCRRAQFLARKLLEDLECEDEEAKIFVYKRHTGSIADDEAFALHAALCKYGRNTLLCVRPEDEGHPNGTIIEKRAGLLIGYLDGLSPTSLEREIKYESWLSLCIATYERVRKQTSTVGRQFVSNGA
jgi:hypothetical protein